MTSIFRRSYLLLPALIVGFALVACGGDDDDGDIQVGNDEDYVRASCEAQNEFFAEIFAAAFALDEDASEEDQLEAMEDPARKMRDAVRDARPPADAVDYHRALLDGFESILAAIDDGDLEALDQIGELETEGLLSEDARERLSAIAEDMEECEGFGNPFSDGF